MRKSRNILVAAVAVVGSVVLSLPVLAQTTYTPPTSIPFTTIFTPSTMADGAAVLGGAALLSAFTVGGGFRVAHKLFRWVFAKIG
jgi:hypothetical protein